MSISRQTRLDEDLTIFIAEGRVTARDISEAAHSNLMGSEPPSRNTLWDFRNADLSGVASDCFVSIPRILASPDSRFRERAGGRTAFVASRGLEFGLLRMLQACSEFQTGKLSIDVDFEVFYDVEQALGWLQGDCADCP